jgi:hypothetical protein
MSSSFCVQVWQAIERVLQEETDTNNSSSNNSRSGHTFQPRLRHNSLDEAEPDTPTFAQLAPVQSQGSHAQQQQQQQLLQQQQPHFPVISLKVRYKIKVLFSLSIEQSYGVDN